MQTPFGSRVRVAALGLAIALFSPTALSEHEPLGAVPDFGPHAAVLTHTLLDAVESDFNRSLHKTLGGRHVIDHWLPDEEPDEDGSDPGSLMWMRDYVPIFVRRAKGGLVALQYLSEDSFRRSAYVANAGRLWVPTSEHEGRWVKRELLPLIHENGNLVSTGRWFLIAETLFHDNAVTLEDPTLAAAGYRPRSRDEVMGLLSRSFQRPAQHFIVLPPLPGEATGHVDTFVLALGPNTVLVPEIRSEALAVTEDGVDFDLAVDVQWFLEEAVQILEKKGVEVLRAPMVAPRSLQAADSDDPEVLDNVFYTPANTLVVTGPQGRDAFVPSFERSSALYPRERKLQRSYEREWRKLLEARGLAVHAVRAEELARYLGLVRCVTAAVPAAVAPPAPAKPVVETAAAPKVRRRSAG